MAKCSGKRSTRPLPIPGRRFQGDSQWQRDFGAMAKALARLKEHVIAGHQLQDAGAHEEAAEELQLADAEQELAELYRESLSGTA
jgi:phage terminase Nu1 subunit (DNA packaging protein)